MIYGRKRRRIQTALDLKEIAEEAKHALIEKARDVWDVTQDVSKMTNNKMIAIIRPLRKTDKPAVPSK